MTLLELRTAETVAAGRHGAAADPRRVSPRCGRLPAESRGQTTIRQLAPGLAVAGVGARLRPRVALERSSGPAASALFPLLDIHTKGKARGAPIGIFVLVALAVILYLALRLAQWSAK